MALISEAVRLHKSLPMEEALGLDGHTEPYSRARTCVAWAIHHVDMSVLSFSV